MIRHINVFHIAIIQICSYKCEEGFTEQDLLYICVPECITQHKSVLLHKRNI